MFTTMKYFTFVIIIHSAFGAFVFHDQGSVIAENGSSGNLDTFPELQKDVAKQLDDAFEEFIQCDSNEPFFVNSDGVSVFLAVELNKIQGNSGGIQYYSVAGNNPEEGYGNTRNTLHTKIISHEDTRAKLKEDGYNSPEEGLKFGLNFISSTLFPILKIRPKLKEGITPFGFRVRLVNGYATKGEHELGTYVFIGAFFSKT